MAGSLRGRKANRRRELASGFDFEKPVGNCVVSACRYGTISPVTDRLSALSNHPHFADGEEHIYEFRSRFLLRTGVAAGPLAAARPTGRPVRSGLTGAIPAPTRFRPFANPDPHAAATSSASETRAGTHHSVIEPRSQVARPSQRRCRAKAGDRPTGKHEKRGPHGWPPLPFVERQPRPPADATIFARPLGHRGPPVGISG